MFGCTEIQPSKNLCTNASRRWMLEFVVSKEEKLVLRRSGSKRFSYQVVNMFRLMQKNYRPIPEIEKRSAIF